MTAERKRLLLSLGIIFFVLLLDQSLKFWVKTHMLLYEDSYWYWENWPFKWFRLRFLENSGMAFGITFPGQYGKIILTLFRLVLLVLLVYFLIKLGKKSTVWFTVFMSLIIAGALGNLIDSMFYGLIFTESPHFGLGNEPARLVPFGQGYGKFFQGKVVDMLYFELIRTDLPQWIPVVGGREFVFFRPVFNIADSAIFIGTVGLILFKNKLVQDEQDGDNS